MRLIKQRSRSLRRIRRKMKKRPRSVTRGRELSTSSCLLSRLPLVWETSGGSLISVSRTEEVNHLKKWYLLVTLIQLIS